MGITIHQFAAATAVGDGVTGGIFYTRSLLRQLGYQSEIYAGTVPEPLTDEIRPASEFDAADCQLLLVHHSMGHEYEEWLFGQLCPRLLMYHNITPPHFFPDGSPEQFFADIGRQQLRAWPEHFVGAVGMSPYNSAELNEAGFAPVSTLPLLVDPARFEGDSDAPRDLPWDSQRPLLLSVGRIVENKRQHLLLDALWYLKQQGVSPLPALCLVGGVTSPNYKQALQAHVQHLGLEDHVWFAGKLSDAELRWLYKQASAFWCASEHEGFGMPLVESGLYRLPVVAFDSSNIADTLGQSGVVLPDPDPRAMAAVTTEILTDKTLVQSLGEAGYRNLDRYRPQTLLPQLQQTLLRLGLWRESSLPQGQRQTITSRAE